MKKIIIAIVLISIAVAIALGYNNKIEFVAASVPQVEKKSRIETVKDMINDLQKERENDPTFKAKTKEMQNELDKEISHMRKALEDHRKAQSRLDALMIVQTQYDVEISDLKESTE